MMIRFLLILAATTPSQQVWAESTCIQSTLKQLLSEKHYSAIEVEIETTPPVLNLITTTDGKISSLFYQPTHDRIDHLIANKNDSWELLSIGDKKAVLLAASKARKQDFFRDRTFHGIKVKDEIQINLENEITLFGTQYPQGPARIPLRFFEAKIEYASPQSVRDLSGLELHIRTDLPAGDASADAYRFFNAIKSPLTHQHIHIPAPIPKLTLSRPDGALELSEFYRRSNLAVELYTIVKRRSNVATRSLDGVVYFDHLNKQKLKVAQDYFKNLATKNVTQVGKNAKMSYVGLRDHATYDAANLWGLELRTHLAGDEVLTDFINGIQKKMLTEKFGISKRSLKAAQNYDTLPWYFPETNTLYTLMKKHNPKLQNDLKHFQSLHDQNAEVYIVYYDWVNDPILSDLTATERKAFLEIQSYYKESIASGTKTTTEVRNFLLDTELYQRVFQSLGSAAP